MKRFSLFVMMVGLLACARNDVDPHWAQKSNMEQAEIAFAELHKVLRKEAGKMWNYPLDGPLMMVDRDTREIISNEKDSAGYLEAKGNIFTGFLPEEVIIANTAFEWGGKRWTMVAFPLPDSRDGRLKLLIHESFHRIQPYVGFDSVSSTVNNHLDTEQGRIYLKLEFEALKMAMKSDHFESHLKNALLFRLYRHQLFPGSKSNENDLELLEGLPEYTGTMLGIKSSSRLLEHHTAAIDAFYEMPTYVRTFAYFTIPVYGYYMQLTNRAWNLDISEETNLTDYIIDFYDFEYDDPVEYDDVFAAGQHYGRDFIVQAEGIRESERLKRITAYRSAFTGDSVISLALENMSIGFDPRNLVPLDSLGIVYPIMRITDNWGVLEVDSCGALLSPEWNRVTITYPITISDSLVSGMGWRLKLNSSWKIIKTNTQYELKKIK